MSPSALFSRLTDDPRRCPSAATRLAARLPITFSATRCPSVPKTQRRLWLESFCRRCCPRIRTLAPTCCHSSDIPSLTACQSALLICLPALTYLHQRLGRDQGAPQRTLLDALHPSGTQSRQDDARLPPGPALRCLRRFIPGFRLRGALFRHSGRSGAGRLVVLVSAQPYALPLPLAQSGPEDFPLLEDGAAAGPASRRAAAIEGGRQILV